MAGETTRIRIETSRRNMEMVLAEAALSGERAVAIARLALLALRGITMSFAYRGADAMTATGTPGIRPVAIVLYLTWSVMTIYYIFRAKPNYNESKYWPVIHTIADFSFNITMIWTGRDVDGAAQREMAAIGSALIMCFSIVRLHWIHIALSTVLAMGTYSLAVSLAGGTTQTAYIFVMATFVALCGLIMFLNAQLRRMFVGLRRRENLSRFLPRQIVERLVSDGESALEPVQREVTVVFLDIRDFTTISEKMQPRELLNFLDEFMGHMSQIVKAHDGIVNKFLGDGMLAFWNVPDRIAGHAEHALRAALDMRRKVEEINDHRNVHGLRPIRIGLGIHTGTVAAGMLGGSEQHEYTVIGDAVNVASRIEGLNKAHGTDILVSENAWKLAGERFKARRVSEEHVKGRAEPVVIYALEGRIIPASSSVMPVQDAVRDAS